MHISLSLPVLLLALATSVQAGIFRSPNLKSLTTRSFKKTVQGSPVSLRSPHIRFVIANSSPWIETDRRSVYCPLVSSLSAYLLQYEVDTDIEHLR